MTLIYELSASVQIIHAYRLIDPNQTLNGHHPLPCRPIIISSFFHFSFIPKLFSSMARSQNQRTTHFLQKCTHTETHHGYKSSMSEIIITPHLQAKNIKSYQIVNVYLFASPMGLNLDPIGMTFVSLIEKSPTLFPLGLYERYRHFGAILNNGVALKLTKLFKFLLDFLNGGKQRLC